MECPVGKICQFKIVDTVHVEGKDQTLRKRKCLLCGRISYTVEMPVRHDATMKRIWNNNHRRNNPRYIEQYKTRYKECYKERYKGRYKGRYKTSDEEEMCQC